MKQAYHTFDELFEDLSDPENKDRKIFYTIPFHKEARRARLSLGFFEWLKSKKNENEEVKPEDAVSRQDFLKYLSEIESQKFDKSLKAPAVALFCNLTNDSKLVPRNEGESNEVYCKRVCEKYCLKYSDKIRQQFSSSKTRSNTDKVLKLVLPHIDSDSRDIILKHINKDRPNQKLYA